MPGWSRTFELPANDPNFSEGITSRLPNRKTVPASGLQGRLERNSLQQPTVVIRGALQDLH